MSLPDFKVPKELTFLLFTFSYGHMENVSFAIVDKLDCIVHVITYFDVINKPACIF